MSKQVPIADGLFTWPDDTPVLLGGRCTQCDHLDFPHRQHCLRCFTGEMEQCELPRRGTLWTFTTQRFRPPSPPYAGNDTPETFEPFAVGYVELLGALLVEARLTEPDPAKLRIGQEMELVVVPFSADTEGVETLIFAFRPID